MKKPILFILSIVLSVLSYAQDHISLDQCISAAYDNLEFNAQSRYIDKGRIYAMESNNFYNLPGMELNGNASIQNENISIPIDVPGFYIPDVPLNFNRLLINFNQTIYNGNLASKKKLIDSLQYDEQQRSLEIDKIKIKSQVISVYATLLIVHTNKEILNGHISVLDKKYNQLVGAVEGGVSTRSKLQIILAERLNLKQRMIEVTYNETSLIKILNNYTGLDIGNEVILDMPTPEIEINTPLNRPELALIDTKMEGLKAQGILASNARLPYIGVYGSVGMGIPGYDLFNPDSRPMVLGGVIVKWNIWDWNKTKNKKAQLVVGQSILYQQRTRLELAFDRELIKQQTEVEKFNQLILSDDEIIDAQSNISKSILSEFSNGTVTASDYTAQLNTESSARLNKELHQIQLVLAILTYNTLKGK